MTAEPGGGGGEGGGILPYMGYKVFAAPKDVGFSRFGQKKGMVFALCFHHYP